MEQQLDEAIKIMSEERKELFFSIFKSKSELDDINIKRNENISKMNEEKIRIQKEIDEIIQQKYNNLVKEVGGKPTPAVGFGMGIERLIMVLEALGLPIGKSEIPSVYVAPLSPNELSYAYGIVAKLRAKGVSSDTDIVGRSLKAQMKYAGKRGYKFVIVLGESEIKEGVAKIKIMATGEEVAININNLAEEILRR